MKRMPEDYNVRMEGEHRKRKHKKKHFLFSFLMLIFGCAIFILAFILLFHIRKIEVSGNQYCTADEVVGWLQEDKYATNSLYVWIKHHYTDVEQLTLVEESEVTLRNPWTIRVRVYEKEIIGYLEAGNQNIYFDKDGVVVMLSDQDMLEGILKIEGINVELSKVEAHKILPVQDKEVFLAVLEVTQELQKSELVPDQILFVEKDVTLTFGDT